MKRFLNLQNTLLLAVVLVGLLFVTSSFSFGPVEDAQLVGGDSQKKEQRVKVVVNVDGKETKIDTVFNLPDQKMIDEQVDSILSKLDKGGVNCNKKVIFRSDRCMRSHGQDMKRGADDEQFDIFIQNDDSGRTCPKRKVICVRGFDNELMSEDGDDDDMMPPPPPPMPSHAMIMHSRFGSDPFAFDTKDESVVSYEKKDLGNGLEKITIIRKKHEEHSSMKEIKVRAEVMDDANAQKKNDESKVMKKGKVEAENSKNAKK